MIYSAGPTNTTEPSISGQATVGSTLQANRGEWSGQQPITYCYAWQRCNAQGDNCSEIQGANDTEYEVRSGDSGRTLRVRVTARNDRGQNSAISNPTVSSAAARSLRPLRELPAGRGSEGCRRSPRRRVGQLQPEPGDEPHRADHGARQDHGAGRPAGAAARRCSCAPRRGSWRARRRPRGADGFVTLTLVPNDTFPQPRSGFNVQFFIKASRPGDPGLGGIAGYRLVQVRLAG